MRDIYASLRELVPTHLERREDVRQEWTERSDPIWRRGDHWVRVEAVTGTELLLSSGRGDVTDVQRTHGLTPGLDPIALDVAQLLNSGDI